MPSLPTPESLYRSAEQFAESALEAHGTSDFRRFTVDAATCLEHLLKACLAARSPGLLVDLKRGEQSFSSLVRLLGITDAKAPQFLRTVSLRDALIRMRSFVVSEASDKDIETLIDMRDGAIHIGDNEAVEERLVIAFIQHAEALLKDLGRRREWFWGHQLEVVDALLSASTDKTARRVQIKLATSWADYQKRSSEFSFDIHAAAHMIIGNHEADFGEEIIQCPACQSPAWARGDHWVEWDFARGDDGEFHRADGTVWFAASSLRCTVCRLHLTGTAELLVAGLQAQWAITDADPNEYELSDYDEQADLQRWLEKQRNDADGET